jgi:hypothetical protein
MLRRAVVLGLIMGAAVLVVPVASADKPDKAPAPTPDATGRFCTGFDVLVHIETNKETFTLFSDGRGLVTGAFKIDATNLANGKTIHQNVSGPVFFPADGSAIVLRGISLVYGEAGQFGPGSPPMLILVRGVVTVETTGFTIASIRGTTTDLCAALA